MVKICGAKTNAGTPCQRPGTGVGGRCYLHGGRSLTGKDNPAYKHGLYVKHASSEELAEFEDWQARGGAKGKDIPAELEWMIFRCLRMLSQPGAIPPDMLADITNKLMDALLKAQKYRGDEPAQKHANANGENLPAPLLVGVMLADEKATELAAQLTERIGLGAPDPGGPRDGAQPGPVATRPAPGAAEPQTA